MIRARILVELCKKFSFKVLFIESLAPGVWDLESTRAEAFVLEKLHPVYHTHEMRHLLATLAERQLILAGFEMNAEQIEVCRILKRDENPREARSFRDRCLYSNFMSVWAHNNHLMKKTSAAAERDKVFGELMCESFGEKYFVVGQYAGSGNFEHMPGQRVKWPLEEQVNSLARICQAQAEEISFVTNFEKETRFRSPLETLVGSGTPENILVADHFDALLLHKTAVAPERLAPVSGLQLG